MQILNELDIKEKIFVYGLLRGELKFFKRLKSEIKKENLIILKLWGEQIIQTKL